MPLVAASNSYIEGIAKQASEGVVPATATYSFPVFSTRPTGPVWEPRRVEVTNSSSIEGDPTKGPVSWEANSVVLGSDSMLGALLVGMWPTDTPSGTAPSRLHTFTGLGSTPPWIALYSMYVNANYEQTFGKGLLTSLTFTAGPDQDPLQVGFTAIGQETTGATTSAFPATTVTDLVDGFFTLHSATASIQADLDTPNVNPAGNITNVRDVSINVTRAGTPEATATGVNVTNLGLGKVTRGGTMNLLFDTFDAYRGSYFGTVAGTALSATILYGALELNFVHTVSATSLFSLYIPKVGFRAPTPPSVNPSGDAMIQPVELLIAQPSSGDSVQPTLTNNVTAAY